MPDQQSLLASRHIGLGRPILDVSAEYLSVAPLRKGAKAACEALTWTEVFSRVERLIGRPRQAITVGFARGVMQIAGACEGRRIPLDRFSLQASPSRQGWTPWRRASASSSLAATTFVPGLLTFLETPCRIGLVCSDRAEASALQSDLSRHAPWHRFDLLPTLPPKGEDFDILLAADPAQALESGTDTALSHHAGLAIVAPALFGKRRPASRVSSLVLPGGHHAGTSH